ncbi:hypothetical protein LCGC14_0779460 [marine sediment metagenome]|uniref:Homing endonuclease LAGLIDADG domain-containing protein n=1 Tax=marine sediment metagenome TaxID=412755 RepID=A0A0F9QFV5_9ZZZZ
MLDKEKEIITKIYKSIEESEDFAELSTIINGDGNIFYDKGNKYLLRISSNTTEEREYREYTKELIKKVFNIQPKSYPRKGKNATELAIHNREIVEGLIAKGFKPGDKIKNQVSVLEFIKKKENFRIRGIKGLFDTDGSIYLRNTQKSIGLNFKNKSLPLVKDFKEMCESLEIKTQKIPKPKITHDHRYGKDYKCHQVTIENKLYVAKFLDKIKPEKLYNHAKVIGMALLTLQ